MKVGWFFFFFNIWEGQTKYSFPENKIFFSEVAFMAAEHIGGLKSQQQGLSAPKCTDQWLEDFLWVNWNFPFSVKCLFLELGQRTRTAWVPCSAGCSRKRRCSASGFSLVSCSVGVHHWQRHTKAASVNCINSPSVWNKIVIQFLVEN